MKARRKHEALHDELELKVQSYASVYSQLLAVMDQLKSAAGAVAHALGLSMVGSHQPQPPLPFSVLQDGQESTASREQVQQYLAERPVDFIAYAPQNQLYLGPRAKARLGNVFATPLEFGRSHFRILRVGMSLPGQVFGNLSFRRPDRAAIDARTLSRQVHDIRRMLRRSHIAETVIRSVPVGFSVSMSGYGYVFDDAWHYWVIDLNPEFQKGEADQQGGQIHPQE